MAKTITIEYPANHKPGMRVPRGGSSCSSCEYLGSDGKTCKNKFFIEWNGSNVLPAPADEYCSDWYEPEDKKMMEGKKKHKFTNTNVELHDDGSASIHHIHSEGAHKDVKHAVADLDGVHDSFEEHLNPEEEDLEEKVHPGIHKIAEMMGGDEEKNEELVHPGIHAEIMKKAGKGD